MAPTADGGLEASRRMHEYLVSKQRKQEEYWLRKYGKVLQPPPPSVGKPAANPRLPPLAGGSSSGGGGASGAGSSRGSNTGSAAGSGLLPPLAGGKAPGPAVGLLPHHRQQPKGNAPIFHAQEPVKDFFSRNARQPRSSAVASSLDDMGAGLPPSHRPPEPYRRNLPAQLPPMAGGYAQAQLQQRLPGGEQLSQQPSQDYDSHQQHQQQEWAGGSGGGGAASDHAPYHQHASPRGAAGHPPLPRGGVPGGRGLPPVAEGSARSLHGGASSNTAAAKGPLRNLEMELTVIRAIKAREDVLERLRVASGKLDSGFGGSAPVVLSPVDPLVRLFYRLVGTLRQRTLDVIEAIAAWRRKVNPSEPFIYYGIDYLAAIGPDVGFLDELPFLRTRLTFGRAADDPFLAEVTPDGIPIEEATTCDLRRGGQRFSSDALRIRMARKVLAHYCGRPLPGGGSAYTLNGDSSAASAAGLASEPSGPHSSRSAPSLGFQSPRNRLDDSAAATAAAVEDGTMTTAQIIRALSPPVVPVTSLMPPAVRAITPPAAAAATAMTESEPAAAAAEPSPQWDEQEQEEEEERSALRGEPSEARTEVSEAEAEAEQPTAINLDLFNTLPAPPPPPPIEEEPEAEEEAVQQEAEEEEEERTGEVAAEPEPVVPEPVPTAAPPPPPEQPPPEEQLQVFEDDNDFIDFALEALLQSLEPAYVDSVPQGGFTVAGWEIDRQLDEVVRGIGSPERPSRAAARDAAAVTAAAAPPSRGGGGGAAAAAARIPTPPSAPKPPPSRGRSSDTGTSRGSSRIPRPPSVDGAAAAPPPPPPQQQQRPPVRVHLRPGSSGLGMALSMDGEDLALSASNDATTTTTTTARRGSSSGRPGSSAERPGSSAASRTSPSPDRPKGVPFAISARMSFAASDDGLPAIDEDQSALFDTGGGGGDAGGGARPPVRVHLRPNNSRELNMRISMDEDSMMMASPAAPSAAAAAAARSAELSASLDYYEGAAAAAAAAEPAEAGPGAIPPLPVMPMLASLQDAPLPLQGSLSGRANRASLRQSRQGSRPGSASMMRDSVASSTGGGLGASGDDLEP